MNSEALLFPLILVIMAFVVRRTMSTMPLIFQILLTLLPWGLWAFSVEPWANLAAWLLHAGLLFLFWSRRSNRVETEALTKWLLSSLLGVTLLGIAMWETELASLLFWPLDGTLISARLQYAVVSASWLVGSALLLGWPPVQQGWADLWETGGVQGLRRMEYFFLYISLVSMLWLLSILIEHRLRLSGIAVGLSLLLCLAKIVLGLQMSVFRSLGYGVSVFAWPLLVRWSLGAEYAWLTYPLLGLNVLGLILFLRVSSEFKVEGKSWQWDDEQLPSQLRPRWMTFLRWDLLQIILSWPLLYWAQSYAMLAVSMLYALCHYSVLRDPQAFASRVPAQIT